MRILKIIVGLACFFAAFLCGLIVLASIPVFGFDLGLLTLALFAVCLAAVGWFLITRRNSTSKTVVVTMILAILFGVLPSAWFFWRVTHMDKRPLKIMAEGQMKQLELAIRVYQSDYNCFPVSSNTAKLSSKDFTFGTWNTSDSALGITNAGGRQANNSEIVAVLGALKDGPDPYTLRSTNANGVLLDPWGHPYIITLDLNGDEKCRDAFYQLASVSEIDPTEQVGLNELARPTPPPYATSATRDSFEAPGTVMVWSFGPDGKADRSKKANAGVNKDNIVLIDGFFIH